MTPLVNKGDKEKVEKTDVKNCLLRIALIDKLLSLGYRTIDVGGKLTRVPLSNDDIKVLQERSKGYQDLAITALLL